MLSGEGSLAAPNGVERCRDRYRLAACEGAGDAAIGVGASGPGNAFTRYGRAELAVRWEGEGVLRVADPQSGVTRQITLPTSSATSSAPRPSSATPTGRP